LGPIHYRGRNAAEMLILQLLKYEEKTKKALADKQPLVKTPEDWASYTGATQQHIFENVWIPNLCTWLYCGQSHRKCMYESRAAGSKAK